MPRFAANLTMMFNEHPFLDRFAAAAQAGFTGVEFLFPYDHSPQEISKALRQNALENVLFNLPPGDWAAGERGIAALPGREAEFRAGLTQAIEYALILGTTRLHAMAGIVAPDADMSLHLNSYIANLRHAAGELARHGLTLLIEPINTRDMPGYFLHSQKEAHAIREAVGADNLKVQMDFYHAQISEGDIAVKLRQYLPWIGHIQIASVPERNEPDGGELNYPWLFRLLDELGYTGWLGCEYRPRPAHTTIESLNWFREIQ